jgi:hypothetical protein
MDVLGWMGLRKEGNEVSQAIPERGCVWMLFLAWSWEKGVGGRFYARAVTLVWRGVLAECSAGVRSPVD